MWDVNSTRIVGKSDCESGKYSIISSILNSLLTRILDNVLGVTASVGNRFATSCRDGSISIWQFTEDGKMDRDINDMDAEYKHDSSSMQMDIEDPNQT